MSAYNLIASVMRTNAVLAVISRYDPLTGGVVGLESKPGYVRLCPLMEELTC